MKLYTQCSSVLVTQCMELMFMNCTNLNFDILYLSLLLSIMENIHLYFSSKVKSNNLSYYLLYIDKNYFCRHLSKQYF